MAHLNKLDYEYTLEEAKNVDANDITTHPFFKKHFATSNSRPGSFNSTLYVKPDKEQDHVIHYITHTPLDPHHESNIDHSKHAVKIETQHYGRTKHIGHGRGMTVHEAMDNAVHTYTHPLKIKPLTESLVGKKPATASKLFAEEMEVRLDEISKKTLGSYVKNASEDARTLENISGSVEGKYPERAKKLSRLATKRQNGVNKAIDRLTKEDLDEVEAPANFWNAGMAGMNPIQVSQKQPAEPGQFKATLTKSPKRLADQDSSLEGKPRAVRDETEATAASRGPKTIELTGDWHADVPDHQFDPKLDSETEYYPLFSQFKSLGAYPSGPARAWESEEIDEDELNEISKKLTGKYVEFAIRDRDRHIEDVAHARASADALQNVRTGTNYVADDKKRDLRGLLGDMERKARDKQHKRERGILHALDRLTKEDLDEDELNEISKKTLGRYIEIAANSKMMAGVRSQEAPIDSEEEKKQLNKIRKRSHGISRAVKKLTEDSASLMATATKDEKKAAEQDKKKPAEFKKLHDKHEAEVKSKMKELGEEALQEGLFDPAKQPLLALWDEHARRSDAHGSGSRTEILKRIEDHVAKKHGQEGLKKMRLHSDLSNALKNSVSGDKGHLQALLGNMRAKCAMEQ